MNYQEMSDCMIFDGYKNKDGYGRQTVNGKVRQAHRVSYCQHNNIELENISGLVVMHICDNPPCINPHHLKLGSQIDNIQDMIKKGRGARNTGNKNQAKISDLDVIEIRKRYKPRCKNNSGAALAKRYGLSRAAISLIVNNKNWIDILDLHRIPHDERR